MAGRRALHFVFKVGNRRDTINFYRNVLGMKVLRHEEFEEGCKAACNGPYDGKWSKTMVGYGAEDDHFVVELTYNYGIKEYKLGNDFQGITILSSDVVSNAQSNAYDVKVNDDGTASLIAPGGYKFNIKDGKCDHDPVQKVTLGVSNLKKSVDYWHGLLSMELVEQSSNKAVLRYGVKQCHLELLQLEDPVGHATAFGRIAFACPSEQLKSIEKQSQDSGNTILTPYVSLDTPGKATVEVVILADPDGHEICFVGDEGFRELSQVDPSGDELLNKAMDADKSDEWFAKKRAKEEARAAAKQT